jgi:hypothetical protein
MMHSNWWVPSLYSAIAAWQESGENPVVFCYLIVWGLFLSWRSPKLTALIERPGAACWTRSSTFSTRFITPRGSGS